MIFLGIDPGTATIGYASTELLNGCLKALDFGTINTSPKKSTEHRLLEAYEKIESLICKYKPNALILERLFFCKNEKTALSVGRTVGIAMLAAAKHQIPVFEYTPLQVKSAVTGYGSAQKNQVQYMVQKILKLDEMPKPDDAADALALCITHANSFKMQSLKINHNSSSIL